jgi:radical SAM modification target selenobiotic family peptide
MDREDLKRILASISIAGLIATTGLAGCTTTGKSKSACTGDKPEKSRTSCSGEKEDKGTSSCTGEKEDKGKSSCTGEKPSKSG